MVTDVDKSQDAGRRMGSDDGHLISAPRWGTVLIAAVLLFVFAGVIGLMFAIALALVRSRSQTLSGPAAVVDVEDPSTGLPASTVRGSTIVAVTVVLDVVALLLAQLSASVAAQVIADGGALLPSAVLERADARLISSAPCILIALALLAVMGRYRGLYRWVGRPAPVIGAVVCTLIVDLWLTATSPVEVLVAWALALALLLLNHGVGHRVLHSLGAVGDTVVMIGRSGTVDGLDPGLAAVRTGQVRALREAPVLSSEGVRKLLDVLGAAPEQAMRTRVMLCASVEETREAVAALRRFEALAVPCSLSVDLGPEARGGLGSAAHLHAGVLAIPGVLLGDRPGQHVLKWCVDMIGALLGMLIFLPLFFVLACIVLADGGPVLFSHERVGRHGARFRCLKLRTMRVDAEAALRELLERDPEARAEWQRDFKLRDDPRITRIGRFLRRTSLDELPQFVNVLKGEMSLVGPRPIVPRELADYYGDAAAAYLSVRPGLTGLWQISGRNDLSYAERVALDTEYALTWSVGKDVMIMLRTVEVMLQRRGAY